jgi:predicted esterase
MMRETAPMLEPDEGPRPVTLAFHSLCFDPVVTCDWFRPGELAPQWQLCPRAPTPCGGGGYRWDAGPDSVRRVVERAVETAKARHGARVRDDSIVLVGYSNGAFAVASLVHAYAQQPEPPGFVKGIVLFGAGVDLGAADVRRLGARVGYTAGDMDGSAWQLRAGAEALRRQGVEARFVSLGRVGHVIPQSTSPVIARLIDWARDGDPPPSAPASATDDAAAPAAPVTKPPPSRWATGDWGMARPPDAPEGPRPVVMYLHGMWASPEDSCPPIEAAAAPRGFFVCPRGNAPLGAGNTFTGSYATIRPRLDAARAAAEQLAPGRVARNGGVLMGFSSGAYFAVQTALGEPGRWRGLVLMAMDLQLDAAALRRAGIERVVLAAGDLDGARATMKSQADALAAAGLEARFVSLGPVGHHFAVDMADRMTDALAWVLREQGAR